MQERKIDNINFIGNVENTFLNREASVCLGCKTASYTGFLCVINTTWFGPLVSLSIAPFATFVFPFPYSIHSTAQKHTNTLYSACPSLTQFQNAFTQTVLKPICNIHNCPEIPSKSVYIMNKVCILDENRLAFGLFQNAQHTYAGKITVDVRGKPSEERERERTVYA